MGSRLSLELGTEEEPSFDDASVHSKSSKTQSIRNGEWRSEPGLVNGVERSLTMPVASTRTWRVGGDDRCDNGPIFCWKNDDLSRNLNGWLTLLRPVLFLYQELFTMFVELCVLFEYWDNRMNSSRSFGRLPSLFLFFLGFKKGSKWDQAYQVCRRACSYYPFTH